MQATSDQEKWYQLALRFQGDELAVEEIANKLEVCPSTTGKKGQNINGNARHSKYPTNIWVWTVTRDSSISFEEQIAELLLLLEAKGDVVKQLLSFPTVSGEIFLGFSSANGQGGAYFSAALLARISALGLALNLDLYPSC